MEDGRWSEQSRVEHNHISWTNAAAVQLCAYRYHFTVKMKESYIV